MTKNQFCELYLCMPIKRIWVWIKHKDNIALVANVATIIILVYTINSVRLLKNQVYVANSLSISQIGDRCMWYSPHFGDYDSYLLLKKMEEDPINKDMKKAIQNQISRVERRYQSTDIMINYAKFIKAIWKRNVDPTKEDVWAEIDSVDINTILDHMESRYLDVENIKAAYFMSGVTKDRLKKDEKTWENIFEALIRAINNDAWCLYGRKMALISFCQLSGKKFDGVFDFEKATQYWEDNKQEILKEKDKL